jgi:alkylhydroperoxidase family enzyme
MEFIQTTPPEDAEGAVAAMYQRQQAAWGYLPNYAKVFCHRPEVMARWGMLLAEIKRPMDRRRFELVTFVAALELRNSACALAHGNALRDYFSEREIGAIAAGRMDGILGIAEQSMVRLARQVAGDASRVEAADVAALSAYGYSDAEIFDIVATAAGRAFFAKMLDALGVQADSPLLDSDSTLRRQLTVGRPIDTRPCVVMPAQGRRE